MAGVDALVTDRYLDALLAAAERGAHAAPADTALDAELREATDVLRRSLVRVHPSFRFEERLAARLADLAGEGLPARPGNVIAFRPRSPIAPADPLLEAVLDGTLDPADADAVAVAEGLRSRTRPLIVGGAITSAAISLVGVALMAWRASRPEARAAHERPLRERPLGKRPLRERSDGALAANGAGGPA
jgi:hypothetical protein